MHIFFHPCPQIIRCPPMLCLQHYPVFVIKDRGDHCVILQTLK